MTPEQTRAARAWLGWNQAELAQRAGVGLSTVKDYEGKKQRTPIKATLQAMKAALEGGGVRFGPDSISGPIGAAGGGTGGETTRPRGSHPGEPDIPLDTAAHSPRGKSDPR